MGGIFLVVATSLEAAVPPLWVWLCCMVGGVVAYQVVSVMVYAYMLNIYNPRPQNQPQRPAQAPMAPTVGTVPTVRTRPSPPPSHPEAEPEAELMNLPEPLNTVLRLVSDEWIRGTAWNGLVALVNEPGANLSRRSLVGLVDQRFYSPRPPDVTTPFPELMVQIGAALVADDGASYRWSSDAPAVLSELVYQLHSPTLMAE